MGDSTPPLQNGQPLAARPTRVRYAVLAAGCVMALIAYVDRLGLEKLATRIKEDFQLSDVSIGYLTAAFLISYGGFQIPTGLAGDRFGARRALPLFVTGWSLALAAVALVPTGGGLVWLSLGLLAALRVVFGAFQSGAFPTFARVVGDWLPVTERASAQGLMWTTSRLAAFFTPFLVTWMVGLSGGWRVPLAVLAAVGVLWGVAFTSWFRNRPEEAARVNDAERALIQAGRPPPRGPTPPVPWRRILRSRNFWCLCGMYGGCGPAGNFMILALPYYLQEHRKLDEETANWVMGVPFAVGLVACFLGGVVSDWLVRRTGSRRWGRRINGLFGLSVAGLAFAATVWVEDPWLLGLLLCLTQFGNDFCMGPAWAAATDIGDRYAGTVSGAMNMTSNCTGAVARAAVGYLLATRNPDAVMWGFLAFGGTYLFAALCWLGIDVTRPVTAEA